MTHQRLAWPSVVAAAGLALALAACSISENDASAVLNVEQTHKINVSSHFVTTPVMVSPNGNELAPEEAAKLAGLVKDFVRAGGDVFEIAVPKGTGSRAQAEARADVVRRFALSYGAVPQELQIRYTDIAGDGPIVVSYERFVATPPRCGPTVDNMAYNPNNLSQDTYGCVMQHNLANMVSNPADLMHMQREMPSDAQRRTKVIDDYRGGRSTSSSGAARAGSAASF